MTSWVDVAEAAVVAQVVTRLEALEVRLEVLVARLEWLAVVHPNCPHQATPEELLLALESESSAQASDE